MTFGTKGNVRIAKAEALLIGTYRGGEMCEHPTIPSDEKDLKTLDLGLRAFSWNVEKMV